MMTKYELKVSNLIYVLPRKIRDLKLVNFCKEVYAPWQKKIYDSPTYSCKFGTIKRAVTVMIFAWMKKFWKSRNALWRSIKPLNAGYQPKNNLESSPVHASRVLDWMVTSWISNITSSWVDFHRLFISGHKTEYSTQSAFTDLFLRIWSVIIIDYGIYVNLFFFRLDRCKCNGKLKTNRFAQRGHIITGYNSYAGFIAALPFNPRSYCEIFGWVYRWYFTWLPEQNQKIISRGRQCAPSQSSKITKYLYNWLMIKKRLPTPTTISNLTQFKVSESQQYYAILASVTRV